ncbi:LicD family protein, partial [Vibrio parahaemolyticus]
NGRIKGVGINIDIFPIDSLGKEKGAAKLRFSLMKAINFFARIQRSRHDRANPIVNIAFRLFQKCLKLLPKKWFLSA